MQKCKIEIEEKKTKKTLAIATFYAFNIKDFENKKNDVGIYAKNHFKNFDYNVIIIKKYLFN